MGLIDSPSGYNDEEENQCPSPVSNSGSPLCSQLTLRTHGLIYIPSRADPISIPLRSVFFDSLVLIVTMQVFRTRV